jgi:ParB/RepB/Spo0J family partition protein
MLQEQEQQGTSPRLSYVTRKLPLDRLIVMHEEKLATSAKQFEANIALVGVLHSPIVVLETGDSIDDPAALFRVVAGRKRVAGARRAGDELIDCRVYEQLDDRYRALIILSENFHRSASWVQELKAILTLTSEKIGMIDKDIAQALGVSIAKVREYLKISALPEPVIEQIIIGEVSHETAKKVARLTQGEQAKVAERAEAGETITDEMIKAVLKKQIVDGLAPVQEALVAQEEAAPVVEPEASHADIEMIAMSLATWGQSLATNPRAARARMLMRALSQEIDILRRTN